MTGLVTKTTLGLVAGATALTVAAPADAQRYRHYDRDRDNSGAVIAAGIAGIVIGAAITSNNRHDRRYDYDRRYYQQRGYYPSDGYYARQHYRDYRRCEIRRVWDPYERRRVRVRYCR